MILYTKLYGNRRPEFQIITTIEEIKGQKIVCKRAASKSSKNHLLGLINKAERLKSLEPLIKINPPSLNKEKDTLIYEYINGENFAEIIDNALLSKNYNLVNSSLEIVFDLIDKAPSHYADPGKSRDFKQIFGNVFTGKLECINCGYIDFNFDNLIKSLSGELFLIDHEWVFDFPIPKQLVKGRVIVSYFMKYNQLFKTLAAEDNPMREIAKDFFLPEEIYQKNKKLLINVKQYLEIENRFQEYVSLVVSPYCIDKKLQLYTAPVPPFDKISLLSLNTKLNAKIQYLEWENAEFKLKLDKVKNLLLWKYTSKLYKLLRRGTK